MPLRNRRTFARAIYALQDCPVNSKRPFCEKHVELTRRPGCHCPAPGPAICVGTPAGFRLTRLKPVWLKPVWLKPSLAFIMLKPGALVALASIGKEAADDARLLGDASGELLWTISPLLLQYIRGRGGIK
mmetsp:Transcript_104260/g.185282  ORF Transcript_104260/g.185282 Transcript_104260/m.185282 type:complete len:130 (-) Transcript_104260:353-742(-)